MNNLIITLIATFVALLTGYLVQVWSHGSGNPTWAELPQKISSKMKHVLVLYVTPWVLLISFWSLELKAWMLTLPVLGILSHFLGGGLGLMAARRLHMPPAQAGSMFAVSMLSNLNSMGGLASYVFFGEVGFALGAVYRMFEPIIMFGFTFPMSAAIGGRYSGDGSRFVWARRAMKDPYVVLPNVGLLAGLLLNVSPWSRPLLIDALSSWIIVGNSLLMVFAIGLSIRPTRVAAYIRPSLIVTTIKYVAVPAGLALIAYLLGYTRMEDGLPFRVVVLMSSMPVAFNALVPPTLFDLDLDLANSSWLVSTATFAVVLPLLYLLLAG